MPRIAPKQLNRLVRKDMYRLAKLVETEYAASGMSDGDFAKKYEAAFGLPLTQHTVAAARDMIDLAPNYRNNGGGASRLAATRLDKIEATLVKMQAELSRTQDRLNVYVSGSRG